MASLSTLLVTGTGFHAHANNEKSIVTLGEDLTSKQQQAVLTEMAVNESDTKIITISNEEEHQYLDKYVPKKLIGSKSLSSSKITKTDPGSGISVETQNITWVTNDMYVNALATAGIKDSKIYITAPTDVSGTAALTGVMKAYEVSEKVKIPEGLKQLANEEMVKTAQLADQIGTEETEAFMQQLKDEITKQKPDTPVEIEKIIKYTAIAAGVELSDEMVSTLAALFMKMNELDIDWNIVSSQVIETGEKVNEFVQSEETQSFLTNVWTSIKEAASEIWNGIKKLNFDS